jgi:hypothetical protein
MAWKKVIFKTPKKNHKTAPDGLWGQQILTSWCFVAVIYAVLMVAQCFKERNSNSCSISAEWPIKISSDSKRPHFPYLSIWALGAHDAPICREGGWNNGRVICARGERAAWESLCVYSACICCNWIKSWCLVHFCFCASRGGKESESSRHWSSCASESRYHSLVVRARTLSYIQAILLMKWYLDSIGAMRELLSKSVSHPLLPSRDQAFSWRVLCVFNLRRASRLWKYYCPLYQESARAQPHKTLQRNLILWC